MNTHICRRIIQILAILALILFVSTYIYILYTFNKKQIYLSERTCEKPALLRPHISKYDYHNAHLPQCLQKWSSNISIHPRKNSTHLNFRNRDDCINLPTTLILSDEMLSHFPHVSEQLFHFFSIAISPYTLSTQCGSTIKHLIVDTKSRFWNTVVDDDHEWLHHLIQILDNYFNTKVILPSECLIKDHITESNGHKEVVSSTTPLSISHSKYITDTTIMRGKWFEHPADAHLLTAYINKEDPCRLHKQAHVLLSQPIRITILNRRHDRRLMNYYKLSEIIKSMNRLTWNPVTNYSYTAHDDKIYTYNISSKLIFNRNINFEAVDKIDVEKTQLPSQSQLQLQSQSQLQLYDTSVNISLSSTSLSFISSFTSIFSQNDDDDDEENLSVEEIHFESMTLRQQVKVMRETDLLITGHGAALTNIAWMYPCSIVLEIFPWGFYVDFFDGLAASTDILKYSWNEHKGNTVMYNLLRKRPECHYYIESTWKEAQKSLVIDTIWNSIVNQTINITIDSPYYHILYNNKIDYIFKILCTQSAKCRSCTRGFDGININLTHLEVMIQLSVKQRQQCIATHPFYADYN